MDEARSLIKKTQPPVVFFTVIAKTTSIVLHPERDQPGQEILAILL